MDKLDYIAKQFSKARNKKYEHYVVTRIWHTLNNLNVKFVTQQHVSLPNGRALTDMYFPQLKLHIEVDERYHQRQIAKDLQREADIIAATEDQIERIDVSKGIEAVNERIDEIIDKIRFKIEITKDFKLWNLDVEYDPQSYIDKGFITLDDDCSFLKQVDAANCFGKTYKSLQKGGIKHPKEKGKLIWFPRLYENGRWKNSISNDEREIREIALSPDIAKKHIDKVLLEGIYKRIVFARVKSPLGKIMYRFKGEYQLSIEGTHYEKGLLWERIADRVKTYYPEAK